MELVVQLAEHRFVEPVVVGSTPTQLPNAVVAQLVEALDSKPNQCRFESYLRHISPCGWTFHRVSAHSSLTGKRDALSSVFINIRDTIDNYEVRHLMRAQFWGSGYDGGVAPDCKSGT